MSEDELGRTIGLIVVPGTIDAVRVPGSRRRPGMDVAARVSAEEMAGTVRRLATLPNLTVLPGPERLSHELSPDDWFVLARRIQDVLERDQVDGVVLTHGTNNLEEIAFFLSLTVSSPKPVVVTGAMLPWNAAATDGPANLIDAVLVAASNASRSMGVVIAFGRDIFAPRNATKVSTHAPSAFAAPGAGALGSVVDDFGVRYTGMARAPGASPLRFDLATVKVLPRVDVVSSYVGADGAMIDACVAAGASGLVTAAGGGGVTTALETEALGRAVAAGVIVCQASRVRGGLVRPTEERQDRGLVAAGNLSPWKARILLMLALTQTRDVDLIRRYFANS
nr:asparaginase domain-containing protein [Alsobacter ponti]